MKKITKSDVVKLAYNDSIVYNALMRVEKKELTFEEAMLFCVFLLSHRNQHLDELVKTQMNLLGNKTRSIE